MTDYVQWALDAGAVSAVRFTPDQLVFDPRTILKCMYGCADYGFNHTCPYEKAQLHPWDFERILRRYHWGVIIHAHDKHTTQRVSYALEELAFHDGYYFAFSMSDCGLCATCSKVEQKPCRFPEKARPAFHSVGIDVFATARAFGLPIETLPDRDAPDQNWYAAVFIE